MLEIPSPQFVRPVTGEVKASEVLQADSNVEQKLYHDSLQPLKPTGQPKEGDRNFFVQGMWTGLVVCVAPVVIGTLFGTGFAAKKIYRYWG